MRDLDGQLLSHYPPDAVLDRGLAAPLELLAPTGFDLFVGRTLRHLLAQAGLDEPHVACEPYHLISGAVDPHERRLWGERKLDIASQTLEKLGATQARELASRYLDYLDRAGHGHVLAAVHRPGAKGCVCVKRPGAA